MSDPYLARNEGKISVVAEWAWRMTTVIMIPAMAYLLAGFVENRERISHLEANVGTIQAEVMTMSNRVAGMIQDRPTRDELLQNFQDLRLELATIRALISEHMQP